MKKIFSIVIIASAALSVFTSCKNEMDEIFSESAAERLNHTQAKYSKLLTSSQNGWAFEYYPTASADDGAVLYAVKFSTDGSVDVAGAPFASGVIDNEVSCWDIIADNGPVLSFSTYNKLIHQFSDPQDDGMGYEGDYEFAFVYSDTENPDSVIMLKGKKRGLYSRLKMIDENVTPAEYLADVTNFQQTNFPESAPNYLLVHLGDSLLRVDKMSTTTPEIYPFGKDAVLFAKVNSYITTKYGGRYFLRFNKPFVTADGVEASVFYYDPEAQDLKAENDSKIRIAGPDAMDFLLEGHAYQWTRSTNMSQDLKDIHSEINKGFSGVKYTLNTLQIEVAGDDVTLNISYRNNRNVTSTIKYLYKKTVNNDGTVTLAYDSPVGSAESVLKAIPTIQNLIDALNGTFKCESLDNKFNLMRVNLVSATDSGKFINVTFAK